MFRIIKSLIVIIAFASVASGASWGYFSDSETSLGNIFTAGTVEIETTRSGAGTISAADLPEGQCETGEITAENTGSLPAYFWLDMASHTGDAGMWNNLRLLVVNSNDESIYGGLMKDFEKVRVSDAIHSATDPVAPGGTQTIFYAVCLPCSASETLQGKTLSWTLEMTASSGADDFVSAPYSFEDFPDCPADPGGGGTI